MRVVLWAVLVVAVVLMTAAVVGIARLDRTLGLVAGLCALGVLGVLWLALRGPE